jgi:mannose PTS system EIIA component
MTTPITSRLMIVAHAPLASALKTVAAHTFADEAAQVVAVDVAPNESAEALHARLTQHMAAAGGDVLILCDAMGATPHNVSARFAQSGRVHVLTGVNVPMLWRALCYAQEPLVLRTQRAWQGGMQGVEASAPAKPTNP